MGAKGMTSRLLEHYDGDESALAADLQGFLDAPELLEKWSTYCIQHDETDYDAHLLPAFRFSEIPKHMRETAIYSIAVAYLMAQYE